jgi:hypothetical protein
LWEGVAVLALAALAVGLAAFRKLDILTKKWPKVPPE